MTILKPTSRYHWDWYLTEVTVEGDRVKGVAHWENLYPIKNEFSRSFDVKLKENGKFSIGFGSSGCKVPFQIPPISD